tara:strand:- start:420 stop:1385 length:966 start_codon:yes stop_codon:yes gene_type:complete
MTDQIINEIISNVSGPIAEAGVRQKIEALEAEWLKLPQVEIPVVHRFAGGIYAREIIIPEDTLLTGRIYKDDHFDVMVYGDITVTSDEGRKRLTGFNIFTGGQGKKRGGYAHSETKWITFCLSPEMAEESYLESLTCDSFKSFEKSILSRNVVYEIDIKKSFSMQRSYVEKDYAAFRLGYLAAVGLPEKTDVDRDDFALALDEYGFSEKEARDQSESTEDYREITCENVAVMVSPIEGMGLFAAKSILSGKVIMTARCGAYRTQAGRFTNHSALPNAAMGRSGNNINLVALYDIKVGDEITINYRLALDLQIEPRIKLCQQ